MVEAGVEAHVQGHGLAEGEAVMLVEKLIGAEAQIGEDAVNGVAADFGQHVVQFGKVGVKQPDLAGGLGEALFGEFEIAGIDVQTDEQALGSEFLGDEQGMTGPAEGAIDESLARQGV